MPPGPDRGPIVVTGAGGFLGREVVRQALAAGFPVRALVRRPPADPLPVDYRVGDLLDPETRKKALASASAVVHAAGRAHLFQGESSPGQLSRDNTEAAAAVVRAAGEAGAASVVLASSVSVYAAARDAKERDESAPLGPTSPYAESKLDAERCAREIAEGAGAPRLVILRLATLYGPRDPGNVRRLIRAIDRGRFVAVGDGSTRKSLLAVSDAALACLAALGMPEGAETGPAVYNVAAAPCTMAEVVGLIYRHLGRALPRLRVPAPLALALARASRAAGLAEAAESVEKLLRNDAFSGARFSAAAGWRPRVSLDEGLREEIAWYRETLAAGPGAGR